MSASDELRAMAESVGMEIPQAATLMMEAADTITELRGALQVASVDYRHLQDEFWNVTELKVKADFENDKLRKLCEQCAIELYANGNVTDAATENLFDDMRELGIEV